MPQLLNTLHPALFEKDESEDYIQALNELESKGINEILSNLYIFRLLSPAGTKIVNIFIDGCYFGELKCHQYLIKKITPGRHIISFAPDVAVLRQVRIIDEKEITVEQGSDNIFIQMLYQDKDAFKIVPKTKADEEMATMKLAPFVVPKLYE